MSVPRAILLLALGGFAGCKSTSTSTQSQLPPRTFRMQALVSAIRPEFLGLAAETNLIRAQIAPSVYAALVTMTNAAAADVATGDGRRAGGDGATAPVPPVNGPKPSSIAAANSTRDRHPTTRRACPSRCREARSVRPVRRASAPYGRRLASSPARSPSSRRLVRSRRSARPVRRVRCGAASRLAMCRPGPARESATRVCAGRRRLSRPRAVGTRRASARKRTRPSPAPIALFAPSWPFVG